MTYKITPTASGGVSLAPTCLIQITLSSAQTASSGDVVAFDTIASTSTPALSLNTSTGEITLDSSKHYYIQASIQIDRSSTTSSFNFAWIDSSGTVLTTSDGGYDATWEYHTGTVGDTATCTANYITRSPTSAVRLKAITLATSSSVRTDTTVFIMEVTP
jgi:hypothetical protein